MPTSDELLTQAIAAFQTGRLDDAERHFKELLAQDPKHLAGLNLLGMVLTAAQKFDEAERTISAAIAVNGNSDATHYNHGVVLKALNRPEQALASFDKALAINPAIAANWAVRGAALNDLGRHDQAIDSCDKALRIDPNSAGAWNARGAACAILKRPHEAAEAFNRALALRPDLTEAWIGLGGILSLAKQSEDALTAYDRALALNADLSEAWLGRALSLAQMQRKPEAIAAYREALKHGVDAEQVNYHLAAMGAEPPPAISPAANVANAFDQYAETFDQHLTETLKYRVPEMLADTVKRLAPARPMDILDLGCGTGLVGAGLAALKRKLVGIDLSRNMLEKARQRGLYDQLVHGDIAGHLDTQTAEYDLAVAADVFIYIGDLAPVFRGVRRALRDDGMFCFSIESSTDGDFVVRDSFRFAHSLAYIQGLARQNRFAVVEMEPAVIRQEGETRIEGYLVVLRCAG